VIRNGLKTGTLVALVLILAILTLTFYCESKRSQRQTRQVRTQLLAQEAERYGAKVAKVVGRKTVEDAAKEAVGEDIVEGITRVAEIESVAQASYELVSSSQADVEIDGDRLTVREKHGRVTIVGEAKDKGTAQVTLSQSFQYGFVRFQNNGDAILLRVQERSPLDNSLLHEDIVELDQFIMMKKPERQWRDHFGLTIGCGVGVVADMDRLANVFCGAMYGFQF